MKEKMLENVCTKEGYNTHSYLLVFASRNSGRTHETNNSGDPGDLWWDWVEIRQRERDGCKTLHQIHFDSVSFVLFNFEK